MLMALVSLMASTQSGCKLNDIHSARRTAEILSYGAPSVVQVRPVNRRTPLRSLADHFRGPRPPSERTQQVLRRYDLLNSLKARPDEVIAWLQQLVENSSRMEEVYALAEVAKLQADWHQRHRRTSEAIRLNALALIHAHQFLFDSDLNIKRNAYDPQFRQICDIYNRSLESMTRQLCEDDAIASGQTVTIGEGDGAIELTIRLEGRWKDQVFERFELVSDYETDGIENEFHTYGLGVPLIAVLQTEVAATSPQKYYPPSLTLPMTAFFETQPGNAAYSAGDGTPAARQATLRLFDPLENTLAQSHNRMVPLESDLTTPLAYHLKDPLLNGRVLATATLVNSKLADQIQGLYMLEPYDPNKIPVVMVHGLWSSPVTWAQMFNDLRAAADIRANYQFWFYSYSSGQPFALSAAEMREDLANARRELDPYGESAALNQMVLVGHSMGGLISRMQVMNSGNDFWNLVGTGNFDELTGDQQAIERLRKTVFFRANPSIQRVVTIASPHHGSKTSNVTTRWISGKLITLPEAKVRDINSLARRNPDLLLHPEVLTGTSVDSLSPTAPVFTTLNNIPPQPGTTFHNIIGRIERKGIFNLRSREEGLGSDGVVSVESAQYEYATTQAFVPEEHSSVHFHPKCILEVRRILTAHLVQQGRVAQQFIPEEWQPPQAAR